jgi:hypothetical protein
MSALFGHVEDYLKVRRALGYKMERAGWLLPKSRLPGDGRFANADQRPGDFLGPPTDGCQPEPLGCPSGGRPRVRPLPTNNRTVHRGPTVRGVPHPTPSYSGDCPSLDPSGP